MGRRRSWTGRGRRKKTSTVQDYTELLNAASGLLERIREIIIETVSKHVTIQTYSPGPTDQQVENAAYRFMRLKKGCGKDAVNKRFREIVKELRPDVNTDSLTRDKYIALQVAKKALLEKET